MSETETADTRKGRHAIMRTLQRADWALQEDDTSDALNAVMRAIRAAAKMDSYLERPDGLSKVLASAVETVLENDLDGAGMGAVLNAAFPILVLEGEVFRGCGYGM